MRRGSQNLAFARLATVPKLKFNLGGTFETPLRASPLGFFTSANYV